MSKHDDGVHVFEAQCGDCGNVVVAPDEMSHNDTRTFVHRNLYCRGTFMGRPKNRCGWLMSFVRVWVPTAKAAELARDPIPQPARRPRR